MKKQLRNLLLPIALIILVFFILVTINQTAGIVLIARAFNPVFGTVVLYGLLLMYTVMIAVPIIIFITMPPALRPPENEDSPEFDSYIKQLKKQLARNNSIAGTDNPLETLADLNKAMDTLNEQADNVTKSTASTVFVTTAISQNGRLDAILVLLAQVRLIWEVAHIFNQRPSIREMTNLYANVAATALVVGTLEELDIEEQIEPIITPLISSSVFGGIPGAGGLATFMTTSIVEGAANALLTLRVGIITRRYFGMKKISDSRDLRRAASLEAGNMLASIVVKSAGYITEAVIKASKKRAGAVGGSLKNVAAKSAKTMTKATKKSANVVVDLFKKSKK